MPKEPPHDDLIAKLLLSGDTKDIAAAIERERRAKAPPGWLGITPLTGANWQMSFSLGESVVQIDVNPRSSAYRDAGLRTGDYLKPIEVNGAGGVPLDEFDSLTLPCGTKVILKFFRYGTGRASGWMMGEAMLIAPPRTPVVPKWQKVQQIPCGRRVQKAERYKFLGEMSKPGRGFTSAMVKAITVLAVRFDNDKKEGFWPAYAAMAEAFGCSRRHAITMIARLRWLGIVKLVEGPTIKRASNLFQLTWPGHGQPASPSEAPPPRTYRL
jgi:hypothetical protein